MKFVLSHNNVYKVALPVILSWMFAVLAQPLIKLPFGLVPIYLHPLPLYLTVYIFGRVAVYSWALYIFQGALGAPFFSNLGSGILHLCGPTGGYIWGMLFASIFLVCIKKEADSFLKTIFNLTCASFILLIFGLFQLSLYIFWDDLFIMGLYPFIIGEVIKILTVSVSMSSSRVTQKYLGVR